MGYLYRQEAAVSPYPLRVESPVIMDTREAQIDVMQTLREYVRLRKMKVGLVADEWIERQPVTRIVSYGTKIIVRELETADGIVRYWRKIRMLATSYTAATSGKAPDHPLYGITRVGWQAGKGIVAVDPRVVRLLSKMYVPGYGFGAAGDTGGLIKGRRIDLCYDEDSLVLWNSWVDVYLLEPVPPADEIPWLLLDYPSERR